MSTLAPGRNLEIVLLHEVSAGTFARLYLAEARGTGGIERIVAVKILRDQWSESLDVTERMRDEARLLARLRHRNILRVEELAEIDGHLAIIMEFVDGLDLKQLLDTLTARRVRLPLKAALQIGKEAAAALDAAYFKIPYGMDRPLSVIHRDIKPSNLMVSVEGELKVLDFGTARSAHVLRSAQTGALRFGSLKYMSPERREGDRGEHAGDIYALGLVMLETILQEWLPLLPLEPSEHDAAVQQQLRRIAGMGASREWERSLQGLLQSILAVDPARRPTAPELVQRLRPLSEAAPGASLDLFSSELLTQLARDVRGSLTGGALSGTRLVVNVFPTVDAPAASRTVDAPTASSSPTLPRTLDRGFPPQLPPAYNIDAGPTLPRIPKIPREEPGGDTLTQDRSTERSTDTSTDTSFRASEESLSLVEEEAPPARSGGVGWIVAVALGVLLLCGGGLTLGVGAIALLFAYPAHSPSTDAPSSVTTAPAPAPASEVPASAKGDAPLQVEVIGADVQWVRALNASGGAVASGSPTLDTRLAAGDYTLAIKRVGRPVVKAAFSLPAAGASLQCALTPEGTGRCVGLAKPLTLTP